MKAVIMAGGEGTRLRPLTANLPKPMLPMANAPMAEHVVNLLRQHGFEEIVVTVGFLASNIRTYFGDGSELGVHLVYATEETPLGTAGSVLNARDELDDRFLVISGDVLTDVDLTALVEFHDKKGAVATLALEAVPNPLEFGIVIIDADGRVERFLEKPGWGDVFSDTINTGIYVLEPEVFDWITPGPGGRLLLRGLPADAGGRPAAVRLCGRRLLGGRRDARGVPEGARRHPRRQGQDRRARLPAPPRRLARCRGGDPPVGDASSARRSSGTTAASARASSSHGHCVLGANVRVGDNSVIERMRGPRQRLHRLFGQRPGQRHRAFLRRAPGRPPRGRSRARRGIRVGRQAVVGAGVKVYPHKIIEAGAVVNSSIVWESRGSRSLFGRYGVAGIANVDLSPEVALRVALAYATTLPKGRHGRRPREIPAERHAC